MGLNGFGVWCKISDFRPLLLNDSLSVFAFRRNAENEVAGKFNQMFEEC